MKLTVQEIRRYIDAGVFKQALAIKSQPCMAVRLERDTEIATLVEGPAGGAVEETRKAAKAGEWLVTQIVNGIENRYAVGAEKFERTYEREPDGSFLPRRDADGEFPRKLVYLVDRDIEFEPPWGGTFRLFTGGCLVPEDGKFYGINPAELAATHEVVLAAPELARRPVKC